MLSCQPDPPKHTTSPLPPRAEPTPAQPTITPHAASNPTQLKMQPTYYPSPYQHAYAYSATPGQAIYMPPGPYGGITVQPIQPGQVVGHPPSFSYHYQGGRYGSEWPPIALSVPLPAPGFFFPVPAVPTGSPRFLARSTPHAVPIPIVQPTNSDLPRGYNPLPPPGLGSRMVDPHHSGMEYEHTVKRVCKETPWVPGEKYTPDVPEWQHQWSWKFVKPAPAPPAPTPAPKRVSMASPAVKCALKESSGERQREKERRKRRYSSASST